MQIEVFMQTHGRGWRQCFQLECARNVVFLSAVGDAWCDSVWQHWPADSMSHACSLRSMSHLFPLSLELDCSRSLCATCTLRSRSPHQKLSQGGIDTHILQNTRMYLCIILSMSRSSTLYTPTVCTQWDQLVACCVWQAAVLWLQGRRGSSGSRTWWNSRHSDTSGHEAGGQRCQQRTEEAGAAAEAGGLSERPGAPGEDQEGSEDNVVPSVSEGVRGGGAPHAEVWGGCRREDHRVPAGAFSLLYCCCSRPILL